MHPLSDSQQRLVRHKTDHWIQEARKIWCQEFPLIDVRFDLRGKTSGMFVLRQSGFKTEKWIRYNAAIFSLYFQESLSTTVPHEVAHYVCHEIYGRKAKPHGKEWRTIMSEFGVSAEVTCKLDISDLPQKRLRRFAYKCACSEHQLTSIRHNRIQRGQRQYGCPKCGEILISA